MNMLLIFSAAVIATVILLSCGNSTGKATNPASYNNSLMMIINENEANVSKMNAAMTSADYVAAENIRKEWETKLADLIKKATDVGDFKGDAGLKEGVLTGLKAYQKIVTDDYPKLIDIRSNKKEDPAQEKALLENINNAFKTAGNAVNEASDAFEKKYAQ